MTTTKEKAFTRLDAENNIRKQALELAYEIKKITGFLPSVASGNFKKKGDCSIHFYCDPIRRDGDNVSGVNDIAKIIETLPPIENYTLTFAGRDSENTTSPFVFQIQNWRIVGHFPTLSVKYESSFGSVTIEVKGEWYSENIQKGWIDGEHKGFGRYERLQEWKLFNVTPSCIPYSGGTRVYYAKSEEQAKDLKDFITGKS